MELQIARLQERKKQKQCIGFSRIFKKLGNQSINLVFDRTFFTEENYCRLKYKEYSFTDVYEELLEDFAKLDFEIYYVTLYLEDESLYTQRLKRDNKAVPKYAKFEAEKA